MKKVIVLIVFLIGSTVYSQNLSLFNIDASDFPNIKANFYAFDASWNQQNPDKSEVIIKENGLTRTVLDVTCPTPKTPTVLSSVLVMDISNSTNGKNIGIAKAAGSVWVNAMPDDKSECAITTFDHFNYYNQDFTTDKTKLLKAINNLSSANGTDYNKALIGSMCGGLRAIRIGKYQKVIVLMTDGLSSSVTDVGRIVEEANFRKCKIFVITLDMKCPKELKDISTQTGGQYFENITTDSKATEIYRTILKLAQGDEACSITWKSDVKCDSSDTNLELIWKGNKAISIYPTPVLAIHKLEVVPNTILFGPVKPGKSIDTTISIQAIGTDFKITAINLKYGSSDYRIKNVSFPLTIPKNTSYKLHIIYTPIELNLCYGGFEIESDNCSSYFSCNGGFPEKPMKAPTLKLTHPNGGEEFYINSDTLITWTGVVPSDTVSLEYSIDNGLTWNLITDKATGLKYIWKDIPKTASNYCLIKINQVRSINAPYIVWQKTYGGSVVDYQYSFQQTSEGGYIIAGQTHSSDGDVTAFKGTGDCWVVKIDSDGEIEWQKTYGGSDSDWATSIQKTSDGGYILLCTSMSTDGDVTEVKGIRDLWIIKLNSYGAIEWQKTVGGSSNDYSSEIRQTLDGGYIVTGYTYSIDGDVVGNSKSGGNWLVKFSSTGAIEWQKLFSLYSTLFGVIQTRDSGYVVSNISNLDNLIVKLDQFGTIEWQKQYAGSGYLSSNIISQTKDGGYIVAGLSDSTYGDVPGNHGKTDIWVLKLDPSGMLEWQKSLGGSSLEYPRSINQTSDGGYIVGGSTLSSDGDVVGLHGQYDYWCVKLNSSGAIEWQKTLGGSSNDYLTSIDQTKDGQYIAAGYTTSNDGDVCNNKGREDYWVVKLKPISDIFQYDQSDQSDAVFSVIEPNVEANDVDLKQSLVRCTKDSIVSDFIRNNGIVKLSVDSIYFRGADANAFSLVSFLPKYEILPNTWHSAELRFVPKRLGIHSAEMVIITQSDTLIRNIKGEGIKPQLSIESEIVDFGKVNLNSQRDFIQVLTIKNININPIIITNTKINGPNLTDFKTIATIDDFILKPNETKKIDLRFKPSNVGRTSGILAFYYDGVGSPAEVQLYGEGVVGKTQELLSPTNDTINIPIDWDLKWKSYSENSTYNLQVSKDENFAGITIDTTTKLTEYKCKNLDFLRTYFWRVAANNGTDLSDWSPVWKFTTLMDSVNLKTPADLSKNQNVHINMSWEDGIYKKDYRLQISETDDFATTNTDTLISKIMNTDVKNLNYWQKYFWRVRNESGDILGYWSEIWQFKTRMSDILLMYPENTQAGLEQEINFKWNPVIGAEYYQLQISKNDQFTNMVYSKDSITATEILVPDLEKDILYYWRVRVWNEESIGAAIWSEVWTFRTGETSVKDESEYIQIIPNPAGDYITISLKPSEGFEPSEGSEIQLYNTLGEKVMSVGAIHELPLQRIDVSDLPKGIYFVKAGGETAKFVKI